MSDTYEIDHRLPCWPAGTPCPNSCARDHARHVLDNHVQLHGPWAGWRLAGRDLVTPSGERIPERRLRVRPHWVGGRRINLCLRWRRTSLEAHLFHTSTHMACCASIHEGWQGIVTNTARSSLTD